jgi:hypothetical protein
MQQTKSVKDHCATSDNNRTKQQLEDKQDTEFEVRLNKCTIHIPQQNQEKFYPRDKEFVPVQG